jgi:hypothetical protein
MDNIVTRKCAKCKGEIKINKNNITGVIQFQGKYYHYDCFESTATQKVSSKRGKPKMWQEALDNIWTIEEETKQVLAHIIAKDDLNTWLLDHYDISVVPSYFWQLVADLENGTYKQKKCKPVKAQLLYKMWIWGQKHLDKIAANNKAKHKGPSNDEQRLNYDLAIVVQHVGDYKKHITSTKEEQAMVEERIEKQSKINYENLYKQSTSQAHSDSILDLMNEIFKDGAL